MHHDFSAAVIIGRFQPFHKTHQKMVEQALKISDKVIILVGSAHAAPTPKNPFTFEERKAMILASFPAKTFPGKEIHVEPIRDFFYSDELWLAQIQAITDRYTEDGETIALVGSIKDGSSKYLTSFPQWELFIPKLHSSLDATAIREILFDVDFVPGWEDKGNGLRIAPEAADKHNVFFSLTPAPVANFLIEYTKTSRFIKLSEEFKDNRAYRESWAASPFPPVFLTADCVVFCSGHLLVVKRGGNPGKGLLALPGGFVRSNERIKDAAIRELKEETRIRVDKRILHRCVVDKKVFDYPERSLRGRTVTHAFHLKLEGKLPEIKASGADDAKGSYWMPLIEVFRREEEFFEDHLAIIQSMLGGIGFYE